VDVALTAYRAALDALFARTSGGWKLGLDTTRALLASLGDPQLAFPSFHVGGTNGKGSAVATLDALVRGIGLRVGRYTSPHLVDFRERIVIDGEPISEDAVVAFTERWMPEIERLGATFFEATTCLAFECFARARVDVAVIEVGLGGRLDATNVIAPLAAGVTSIGLDHMQYLGTSIEEIAREKAGIFKPGLPAVVGGGDRYVASLLATAARAHGARPIDVVLDTHRISDPCVTSAGTRFTLHHAGGHRELATPLIGRHQAANTALALAMLEVAGAPYAEAAARAESLLGRVFLPGRFQYWNDIIFDVAHNPAGVSVVADTLLHVRPPRPLAVLLAVLGDKDWRAMMEVIAPHVDHFVLAAPPSAPADRAWDVGEALAFATERGWRAIAVADFGDALDGARRSARTTLVLGSFHTVGDAMLRLQVSPLSP
jgi:dihydrofolate synthase/folylpolyglutamate synthase